LLAVDEAFYFRFIFGKGSTSGWNSGKRNSGELFCREQTGTTKATNNSTMTPCSSRAADSELDKEKQIGRNPLPVYHRFITE
jgi:hypothetical protein